MGVSGLQSCPPWQTLHSTSIQDVVQDHLQLSTRPDIYTGRTFQDLHFCPCCKYMCMSLIRNTCSELRQSFVMIKLDFHSLTQRNLLLS